MNTWDVTYAGHVLSGIKEESLLIPLPYNHDEAERLRSLGYRVQQTSNGVIIERP